MDIKKVESLINHVDLKSLIHEKIGSELIGLDCYKNGDSKKQLELCQVGKFLASFYPEFFIKEVREEPDFIISNGIQSIGLEHEVILNEKIKKKHGFYENIFKLVERDLQNKSELPNFLINCYLKPNLSFKMRDKKYLIRLLKDLIVEYVENNNLKENPLIERVFKMPHSRKSVRVNFGAYMEAELNEKIVYHFIDKKEKKFFNYYDNTNLNQWLILLVGGVGESSFIINELMNFDNLKTKFSKVFLMCDFGNTLYIIK